jgi:hypothetical protein
MCYGDVDHGKDGYYRQWLEQEQEKHEQENREIEVNNDKE